MFAFIDLLKFLAIMLVANSHFKGVYPSDVLSFGGGFGLALFYMVSGYLLANIHESTNFKKWYSKKLLGLYIPLWLIVGFEVVIGYIKIDSVAYFIKRFFYPGMWFTASMVIMYAVYYLFVKFFYNKYGEKSICIMLSILSAIYVYLYCFRPAIATFSFEHLNLVETFAVETPYLITHTAWMASMLIGFYMKKRWKCNYKNINPALCVGIVVVSTALFAGQRFLERTGNSIAVYAEILLPIIYLGFAIGLFGFFMSYEDNLKKLMYKPIGKAISSISHSSIEIYYIQFIWISKFKAVGFPVNLMIIIIGMCFSAILFHAVSQTITKRIYS